MSALNLALLSREEKEALLDDLDEKSRRKETNKLQHFEPYEWQKHLYRSGLKFKQRMLMAANRVGKTYSAAMEFAYHATGLYPDDWEGLRFGFAPKMWALGVTGEQIRDVIQTELCGDALDGENFGKGAIPLDNIVLESIVRAGQTKGLIKEFKVRHVSGGQSTISFKAYSQGQHVLMGQSIDFIWIDEEPKDQTIYPQCVTRTSTGNRGKGGCVLLTFTPENGMTPLVCQFMEDIQEGQYLQNVTWDDAPHLTDEVKAQILAAIPEYQREMRSKGIPILGSGVIFPVADELIKCPAFQCPDHFRVINAVDFGWDHPQAIAQLWIDPDTDITYLANLWRKAERDSDQAYTATKGWARDIPTAWPADGHQHEKGGGEQLAKQYRKAGFKMLGTHATWPEGGVSVESGLWQMNEDMREGKFKVFEHLGEFFEEKRLYHRDDHGRIVKVKDDALSATRYGYMMKRSAVPMGGILKLRNGGRRSGPNIVTEYDPYN